MSQNHKQEATGAWPATLILVRHGETEGNAQQVWHGSLDAPLTPRGRLQVAATAKRMAGVQQAYPISAFYVSPLPCARSTAQAIAQAIGIEPQIDPELREFDLGDWEGRTFRDLKETEDLWTHWSADPHFAPPNGESPRSFNRRVVEALQRLVQQHAGQTVLVVTHGGVICNVLATWLGAGPDAWRDWDPHNCAISILRWDGRHWQPLSVNDISHLPLAARNSQEFQY